MTTPPDRRATITEGDRKAAHAFVESFDRHRCDDDFHDWVCTAAAQSRADTRGAAEAKHKSEMDAALAHFDEVLAERNVLRDLIQQAPLVRALLSESEAEKDRQIDLRVAAEARASILVRALEEMERWAKQVRISYPGIAASRALAEYAEAGAKAP